MMSPKFSQNVHPPLLTLSSFIGNIFTKGAIKGIPCGTGHHIVLCCCYYQCRSRPAVMAARNCALCRDEGAEWMETNVDRRSRKRAGRPPRQQTWTTDELHPNSRNSISRNVEPMELCCKIGHMWIFINCVLEFYVLGLCCVRVVNGNALSSSLLWAFRWNYFANHN